MRMYFFGNMYLSSIQQGIQAAHVVTEMFNENPLESGTDQVEILYEWSHDHKTMILLNGGYGSNLHDLVDFFDQDDNPYPFSYFKESEAALDNAITSVGIILPEKIYEGGKIIRKLKLEVEKIYKNGEKLSLAINGERVTYSNWEISLMERLNKFRLAQ